MKTASNRSVTRFKHHAVCFAAPIYLMGCGGGNPPQPVAVTTAKNEPAPTPVSPASPSDQFTFVGYGQDPLKADPVYPTSTGGAGTAAATPRTSPAYYVAPNGSDNAKGSRAAPFRILARAAQAVVEPGVVVLVAPGNYEGGLRTTANGSETQPITYLSTTKWGAKVVPPAAFSSDTAWDNRGDHVTIMGFDIDGSQSRAGQVWMHGIYTGGPFSTIQDNHVHHIAQAGSCNSAGGSAISADSYFHGIQQEILPIPCMTLDLPGANSSRVSTCPPPVSSQTISSTASAKRQSTCGTTRPMSSSPTTRWRIRTTASL